MDTDAALRAAPTAVPLRPGDVHVWSADLDLAPQRVAAFARDLSAEERRRAARYVYARDRDRFIVRRGVLRAILGHYLARDARALDFGYGRYGKPALAPSGGAGSVRFNLSHSGGRALFAVAVGREVGIDIEYMRPDFPSMEVARHFFSPGEVAALQALPADALVSAFYACWSRKEAYIKARGQGLAHPLDGFDVSLEPGRPAALLETRDDPRNAVRWTMRALSAGAGFAAAIVVEGRDCAPSCRQWPGDDERGCDVER